MSILGIADLASSVIEHFFPDKTQEEKDQAAQQLQAMIEQSDLIKGQQTIDQAEAAAATGKLGAVGAFFVAGWRPGVGWSCALAFFWSYVAAPITQYVAALLGHTLTLPALDLDGMMPVLLGMLGLGGMRTFEKTKGVSSAH